jgi:hypothetical protein
MSSKRYDLIYYFSPSLSNFAHARFRITKRLVGRCPPVNVVELFPDRSLKSEHAAEFCKSLVWRRVTYHQEREAIGVTLGEHLHAFQQYSEPEPAHDAVFCSAVSIARNGISLNR